MQFCLNHLIHIRNIYNQSKAVVHSGGYFTKKNIPSNQLPSITFPFRLFQPVANLHLVSVVPGFTLKKFDTAYTTPKLINPFDSSRLQLFTGKIWKRKNLSHWKVISLN